MFIASVGIEIYHITTEEFEFKCSSHDLFERLKEISLEESSLQRVSQPLLPGPESPCPCDDRQQSVMEQGRHVSQ